MKDLRSGRRTLDVLVGLLVLACVTVPGPVLAQTQDQTQTTTDETVAIDNRRFLQVFARDAAVVENAWIELQMRYMDLSGSSQILPGADKALAFAPVLAFSLVDKLEIGGSLPFVDADLSGGLGSESGVGDIPVYAKWQFFHNPIQFTVGLELFLPTGDEDKLLGTGELDFAVFGSVRKNLAEAYLTGVFGFRVNNDASIGSDFGFAGNLEGKTSIFLEGAAMFPLTEHFALSGELEVETERYEQADSLVELTAGAYWLISDLMTVRGGLGLGLADGAPDWEFIGSVVWHF